MRSDDAGPRGHRGHPRAIGLDDVPPPHRLSRLRVQSRAAAPQDSGNSGGARAGSVDGSPRRVIRAWRSTSLRTSRVPRRRAACAPSRSEEHTSELQSLAYLVCRLLLEKKTTVALDDSAEQESGRALSYSAPPDAI